MPIDTIIYNAKLYDPVNGMSPHSALAIFKDMVASIGTDHDILSLQNSDTNLINANGRLVLPTFTDSHTHFWGYVKRQREVDLSECQSLGEALSLIDLKTKETPQGEWITGGGWNYNLWNEGEHPTRHQLDTISTRHYIALDSKDWHTMWVNSPVLDLAGISKDTPYPGAKHLAIDPDTGEFTGILEENIRLSIFNLIPTLSYDKLQYTYKTVLHQFYKLGITGVHTVETPADFRLFQEAFYRDGPALRAFWYLPIKHLDSAQEIAIQNGFGDDFLKIAGVKLFVDGAFGSQTAELLENYQGIGHSGVELLSEVELNELIYKAIKAKMACAIHAIGDRAIRKTLRVLGKHSDKSVEYDLRHRIEHVQLVHPDDFSLFKKYNVIASVQPLHLAADIPIMQKYLNERSQNAYPFRSLHKNGARLIFGSDIPVESFNPWTAIYSAMERQYKLDPEQEPFYEEQKLDLQTGLRAYTYDSAYAVKMENKIGRIQPGMLADLFIPNQDLFGIPTVELQHTQSLLTMLNGNVVYRAVD